MLYLRFDDDGCVLIVVLVKFEMSNKEVMPPSLLLVIKLIIFYAYMMELLLNFALKMEKKEELLVVWGVDVFILYYIMNINYIM